MQQGYILRIIGVSKESHFVRIVLMEGSLVRFTALRLATGPVAPLTAFLKPDLAFKPLERAFQAFIFSGLDFIPPSIRD